MKILNLIPIILYLLLLSSESNAQLFRPYKCGPVLKKDNIQMFDTLNQYLDIKPGDTFAEIGASSGYYDGAMAVYLDNVTFYLQDIDEACLNEKNLDKLLKYYSKFRETPIRQTNKFYISIGTDTHTNLPENSIDVIYSNATYHVLAYPDSILADLHKSLKADGTISIRDQFNLTDEVKYCSDKSCGHPLATKEEFMTSMTRSGFVLIDETDQFGYPVYKFRKAADNPSD